MAATSAGRTSGSAATPMAMPQGQAQRLAEALSRWMETEVVIDASVDPETIGGIVVKVGDRVLDASLRGRLERILARMIGD